MNRYRVFDHTADLGVYVFGTSVQELFNNGAYALFDLMTELNRIQPFTMREIKVEGTGWDDLLINFLRECLYRFHGDGLLFCDYEIAAIDRGGVTALMRGEPFDPARHRIKTEIKAVTYHQASVRKTPHGWKGTIIFDV